MGNRFSYGARAVALLLTAAFLVFAGWQLTATATDNITLTLVSSDDGSSSEDDAIEIETITFAEAEVAIDALPSTNPTITLPTTISGFPSVSLTSVTALSDADSASMAFTGRATAIFGQNFNTGIDVLIVADWDEDDAGDSAPRLLVSGQLANLRSGCFRASDSSVPARSPYSGSPRFASRRSARLPSLSA